MGVVWGVSPGLLDPGTMLLTAIRPGQLEISATVNGVTSSADVRLSLPEVA